MTNQERQSLKRKAERWQKARIFPIWKADAMIQVLIEAGYTYEDTTEAMFDVLDEKGFIIADHPNARALLNNKNQQRA